MALANLNGSENKMNKKICGEMDEVLGGGEWEWSVCVAYMNIFKRKEQVGDFNLLNIPHLPGNVLTTLSCST